MAEGFKTIENPDPAKLETFMNGVTGSVMSILEVTIIPLDLSITNCLLICNGTSLL